MKLFLGILFSFLLISPIFSENFEDLYEESTLDETTVIEEVPTEDTSTSESYLSQNFYTLEIEMGSQSGFDKYVPLTIKITPNETPVKTQVTWDLADDINIKIKHPEFFDSMIKGETYEYKTRVKPTNPGSYEIVANVTAWQRESNYTSSESILIEFNENLIVDPHETNYQVFNIVKIFLIIIGFGGLGFGIYVGGMKLLVVLTEYLKPPEI